MNNKILNINKRSLTADFSWLSNLEKIVRQDFKLKKQISIALVLEKEIQELNRVYRKKDKTTDVLSFELNGNEVLGEIIICLPQAKKQAKQKGVTIKSELQLLTIHGILHLLGYDHEKNNKEFLKQTKAEQQILQKLNKNK